MEATLDWERNRVDQVKVIAFQKLSVRGATPYVYDLLFMRIMLKVSMGWWIVKLGLSFGIRGATPCRWSFLAKLKIEIWGLGERKKNVSWEQRKEELQKLVEATLDWERKRVDQVKVIAFQELSVRGATPYVYDLLFVRIMLKVSMGWWIVKLGLSFGVRGATPYVYDLLFMRIMSKVSMGWWIVKLGLSFGIRGATACIYGYLFIWWMSCIWDNKCLSLW